MEHQVQFFKSFEPRNFKYRPEVLGILKAKA